MDCTDIKVLLSGLVDDTIDATTRYDAERHLADCASCRSLVDEAEALGTLVATDAEQSVGSMELSDDFLGAVLSRTVYADQRHRGAHGGWVNWMGWLAAAACLTLAVTLWVMQMQPSSPVREVVENDAAVTTGSDVVQTGYRSFGFSRILEDEMSPLTLGIPDAFPAAETAPEVAPTGVDTTADATAPPALSARVSEPSLSRADAEVLDSASYLMDILLFADSSGFDDVERIREITEADDLLPRLARARERMSPFDRPAVFAVEGVLLRVARGPLSTEDLQELRDAVADADLAGRLSSMSERWYSAENI